MSVLRWRNNLALRLLLILAITPLSGMCIDIYVPSLPAITHFFHTSIGMVQLTVPAFLLGLGTMQMVYGAMSDSLGRRRLLLFGLLATAATSLLAAVSSSITMLIVSRILQGMAVACPAVLVRAVISDSYTGKALSRASGYMGVAWAMGMILAPVIGGYMQTYFGWHASLFALSGYALLMLCLSYVLIPETNQNKHPLVWREKVADIKQLLSSPLFYYLVTVLLGCFGFLLVFNVVGPFLVQHTLGYSSIVFGHLGMTLGGGWLAGSILSRVLINRFTHRSLLQWSSAVLLFLAVLFGMTTRLMPFTLMLLTIPCLLMFITAAIVFMNAFALILRCFSDKPGTASSLYGSLMLLGNAVLSAIIGSLHVMTHGPMVVLYLVLAALVLFAAYQARRLLLCKSPCTK